MLKPQLPVGGRLREFLPFWRLVSRDQWVTLVIKRGYRLQLDRTPPETGTRRTALRPGDGQSVMLEEVESLCAKSAVVPVPPDQRGTGYYSTYFVVPKKDGGLRPILNLKRFNQYLVKRKFKMESLSSIISVVTPGVWLASIDLKDAYLHVPIAQENHKYMRFSMNGQHLQFVVAAFGLSLAPFLFTRIVKVLLAFLRARGVILFAYLDDILVVGSSREAVYHSLQMTLQVFVNAGFVINVKKSDLLPTQSLVYIGGHFRTDLGRVFLPEDRREALMKAVTSFARVGCLHPVRRWMMILGLMASTIHSVPFARLSMRVIQWHVKNNWHSRQLTDLIMVTNHVLPALRWWTFPANLSQGIPLLAPPTTVTVTTDASGLGWGGHSEILGQTFLFSDLWSDEERARHINVKELRAVRLTLQRLQDHLRDQVVLVECDNSTAVAYLNKQGGTRSWILCQETLSLYEWAMEYQVQLKAVHRPGVDNQLADYLSRNRPDDNEWSLAGRAVRRLFHHWGTPQVDLFASHLNHQLPVWFSRLPHPMASAVDALSQQWTGLYVYAFPPRKLIKQVLLQIRDQQVEEAIVVVPNWPTRDWYPLLVQMAVAQPVQFRLELDLLSQTLQARGTLFHPDLSRLRLTAWKLNGRRGSTLGSLSKSLIRPWLL